MSLADGKGGRRGGSAGGSVKKSGGSKVSKGGSQGRPLVEDGSTLSHFPVGSCVLVDVDGVRSWHMVAYRIGGSGDPHLRRLTVPPTQSDWNSSPSVTRQVSDRSIVHGSTWPVRVTDGDLNVEADPMIGNLRLDGAPDASGSVARLGRSR